MKHKAAVLVLLLVFSILAAGESYAQAPDLEVRFLYSLVDVNAGESFLIPVTVENKGGGEATDITLSLSSPSPHVSGGTLSLGTLGAGEKQTRHIFGHVSASAGAGFFQLQALAAYKGPGGNPFSSVSVNELTIRVSRVTARPYLAVARASFSPATPDPGQPFTLNLDFENLGAAEARQVVATLDGLDNFEVTSLTNRVIFSAVESGSRRTASFNLRPRPDRAANTVKLTFTYYHEGQETQVELVNLPLGEIRQPEPEPEKSPFLKVASFQAEPEKPAGNFVLNFRLHNLGDGEAKSVLVRLDSSQAFPRETSNVLYVPSLAAGKTVDFSVKMKAASTGQSVFSIPITVSYSGTGKEQYSVQETVSVSAESINLAGEKEPASGTPRVMLGKYTLSQNQVLAGDTVRLTLFIENNSRVEVGNAKISLGVIQLGGETGGTVFSPVNSSNSFFVESIGARRTYTREIDLYVDPNAAARTYIVPVEIVYEDRAGNQYKVDELVNIPVIQESRLQVLSVDVPPVGAPGQPIPVSAEFVNVGKVALKNFLVSIEGDFHKENATYFLASMEIGASDYFMGMIIPREEGLLTGTVVFTYTDNTNKEVRIEKPFEVSVQPMEGGGRDPGMDFPRPEFPPDQGGRTGQSRLPGSLKWLGPLLLALAAAAFITVRKVRAKRGEMFSEDF